MIGLELVCLAIVTTYVVARLVRAEGRGERLSFLARFATLSVASFAGEDSVIRAYGYYAYQAGWSVRLDQVPLVIVLVWPVVIDSAARLARAIVGENARASRAKHALRIATLGAGIVLADASLIEPIAVRAGLWTWVEPGLFDVPLIGIVGWAFFAWAAILVFELTRGRAQLTVVMLAPVATHAMILASWWVAFRWLGGERSGVGAAGLAWGVMIVVAAIVARDGARGKGLATVPVTELLLRLPGALFFFVLLAVTSSKGGSVVTLVAYAAAFAPPYVVALAVRGSKESRNRDLNVA